MRVAALLVLLTGLLLLNGITEAEEAVWHSATLENGARVLMLSCDRPAVGLAFRYSFGSAHDPEGLEGLAHLLEHVTWRRRGEALSADEVVFRKGGRISASTGFSRTVFTWSLPPEHWQCALDFELGRIAELQATIAEIEQEKRVIASELSDRGIPLDRSSSQSLVFAASPFSRPMGGTKESFGRITFKAATDFHERFYLPANLTISICGPIAVSDMIREVHERFSNAREGERAEQLRFPDVYAVLSSGGSMVFRANVSGPQEAAALAVGWEALFNSTSSPLNQSVVLGSAKSRLPQYTQGCMTGGSGVTCWLSCKRDREASCAPVFAGAVAENLSGSSDLVEAGRSRLLAALAAEEASEAGLALSVAEWGSGRRREEWKAALRSVSAREAREAVSAVFSEREPYRTDTAPDEGAAPVTDLGYGPLHDPVDVGAVLVQTMAFEGGLTVAVLKTASSGIASFALDFELQRTTGWKDARIASLAAFHSLRGTENITHELDRLGWSWGIDPQRWEFSGPADTAHKALDRVLGILSNPAANSSEVRLQRAILGHDLDRAGRIAEAGLDRFLPSRLSDAELADSARLWFSAPNCRVAVAGAEVNSQLRRLFTRRFNGEVSEHRLPDVPQRNGQSPRVEIAASPGQVCAVVQGPLAESPEAQAFALLPELLASRRCIYGEMVSALRYGEASCYTISAKCVQHCGELYLTISASVRPGLEDAARASLSGMLARLVKRDIFPVSASELLNALCQPGSNTGPFVPLRAALDGMGTALSASRISFKASLPWLAGASSEAGESK